jgi:eukaryotic-like serine/threonine-protein kinase
MGEAGSLVASRYWLKRRIAAGGIAEDGVAEEWRACDLATGRPVAMRLLWTARAASAERFLDAARRAAQVFHPGVVRVLDYGQAGPEGPLFLVTELVGTCSLATVMRAGPLDPAWVLELIGQVASALDAAHSAGLVHQDISPGNLLLVPGGAVKLTGFGLAPGAGSPGSALCCLGLVAWECLIGSPPVPGASPEPAPRQGRRPLPSLPSLPATVPPGVAGLVADLMAAGPAARPVSVAEVVTRCRDLMAVPMRVAQARQAGSSPGTLLLDPPAQRSGELARVA